MNSILFQPFRLHDLTLRSRVVLASYYFHPFWNLEGQAQQEQMIHFMKNLSMMGALLFIVAPWANPHKAFRVK